jgi:CubicO group peptidase (beta-lactamase class C family)
MKKLIFILFAALVSVSVLAQKKKPAIDTRLVNVDAELQKVLETWKAPGFAVAVIEKDKIVYAKGFGYSDYENKVAVTPNTLFAIGSCSKAFTSALLGLLNKEGKIDFNQSPIKYLPELKFFNDDMNNNIIVKDLMSHRTGLPRHDYSWYLFPTESRDSLIERIVYQEPFAGVREKWYYNNFMFLAQASIAEKITGKSWEENISEKFFKPMGMTRSNLSIEGMKRGGDVAFGYKLEKETTISKMDYYNIAAMSPAGSINSSVNEMANWVKTWIYGGKFNGQELLPAAYVSEAISSQMVVSPGLPEKEHADVHLSNYGYGWFLPPIKVIIVLSMVVILTGFRPAHHFFQAIA